MKHLQHSTPPAGLTTLSEVIGWREALIQLHARIAPHFARPEPRERALRFVQGVLSTVERKNGWQLAEQAREATPYGMQRLLSQATWDADGVRDEIRTFALEHLGTENLIVAVDETSFPKRGTHSAGVSKQYCGTTGDVRNCQVGVFLSLVTEVGHMLIDRELYLPREWTDDPARCSRAHIPPTHPFRTKPQLAILMLERLKEARVSPQWITADTVYGGNPELRTWLQTQGLQYVLAVPSTEPVVLNLPTVGVRRLEVREVPALLAPSAWSHLAMSQGTKGPRLFDWACVPIWHRGQDDGWHSLLIQCPPDPKEDPTFYLVFAAPFTSLLTKVRTLGNRWRIEEDFENSKDAGLDHYEVRSLIGWYHHITLLMLALAFLTSVVVAARTLPTDPPEHLCPLSVPEARRLFSRLLFPPPTSVPLVLHWSAWRRWHQQTASFFHTRHRLETSSKALGPPSRLLRNASSLPCVFPQLPRIS